MKKILGTAVVTICVILSSIANADKGIEALSPELRALLSKEMLALQDGMTSIVPAYVTGDLETISNIAKQMKNSYILKQSITKDQKHELKTKLPASFIKKDKKFHEYAGMLEHVSDKKHMELVGFYYSKLLESCIDCHGEFARHKFPNLVPESSHNSHHH